MEPKLQRLKEILAEVYDLSMAQAVLSWDQQTYMPHSGAEERSQQLATLARLGHMRFTDPEVGQLLDDLKSWAEQQDPDSDNACLIQVARYQYERLVKVDSSWVEQFFHATGVAEGAWEKARENDDFVSFQPYLEKIIDLRRQYAEFYAPYTHVYDPLLNDFERGLKTAEVQAIFESLRTEQVELIRAIQARPQVDDSFLRQPYDEKAQWEFGVDVITRFGFDWNRGRQDRSAHPFTTSFGTGDVRITTRFDRDHPSSAMFSTMHECGHALYDLGISTALYRTPLDDGASMAIHESQSRMFENLVGRSKGFWEFFYPRLQEYFPAQLANVSLDNFYKGINKVTPSLIRTESDEATYNLHIMLRMELEIAMMEGSLKVADLPEAWTQRMQDYLGLTPPNNRVGVLQDIHWSGGSIGYFPTYALGNLVSAQLWERMLVEIPDLEDQIRRGEFATLLDWLRKKIHQHGAKYPPQELVQRVTGSKMDAQPYMRYLKRKFGEIYGL